jgi:hypothetical protein
VTFRLRDPLCRHCGDQGFVRVDHYVDACLACCRSAETEWQEHEEFRQRETAAHAETAPRKAA